MLIALGLICFLFLVATKRLYRIICPSVGPSVVRSVTLSLFGLLGTTYGRISDLVLFNFITRFELLGSKKGRNKTILHPILAVCPLLVVVIVVVLILVVEIKKKLSKGKVDLRFAVVNNKVNSLKSLDFP